MQGQIRQDKIVGSRRFSNYFWVFLWTVKGFYNFEISRFISNTLYVCINDAFDINAPKE